MALLTPDKITTLPNGLIIKEYLLTSHNPNKIAMPAKRKLSLIGVTLHNTADLDRVEDDGEQYTRATVNGNMGDTRVHYYVDDLCAWRNLTDDCEGWHSATGAGGKGNGDTISIECIMKSATDKESLAAMENTAKLIAWIFQQHNWTVEKNLFTHNYWTNYKATGALSADLTAQSLKVCNSKTANPNGKYCPVYILPQWEKFKALVRDYLCATGTPAPVVLYRVRKAWGDAETQKGAFSVLQSAKETAETNSGYKVFNELGEIIYNPAALVSGEREELARLRAEKAAWKQEEINLHGRISALEEKLRLINEISA